LRKKVALGPASRVSASLTENADTPTDKERASLKAWTAARNKCVDQVQREGNAEYRPPLVTYAIEAERQLTSAASQLYDRKISFGDFERQREEINEKMQTKVGGLKRQIQQQNVTFSDTDARARQTQQMQKDVDEAERQAQLAQQQQTQTPNPPARTYSEFRRYAPIRPDPAAVGPYRNCVNLGTRVVCSPR
jgi:hypothetical protein